MAGILTNSGQPSRGSRQLKLIRLEDVVRGEDVTSKAAQAGVQEALTRPRRDAPKAARTPTITAPLDTAERAAILQADNAKQACKKVRKRHARLELNKLQVASLRPRVEAVRSAEIERVAAAARCANLRTLASCIEASATALAELIEKLAPSRGLRRATASAIREIAADLGVPGSLQEIMAQVYSGDAGAVEEPKKTEEPQKMQAAQETLFYSATARLVEQGMWALPGLPTGRRLDGWRCRAAKGERPLHRAAAGCAGPLRADGRYRLTSSWHPLTGGHVGFKSLGNTCYLNAALRPLFFLAPVCEAVSRDASPVALAMKQVLDGLHRRRGPVTTRPVVDVLGIDTTKAGDCSDIFEKLIDVSLRSGRAGALARTFEDLFSFEVRYAATPVRAAKSRVASTEPVC